MGRPEAVSLPETTQLLLAHLLLPSSSGRAKAVAWSGGKVMELSLPCMLRSNSGDSAERSIPGKVSRRTGGSRLSRADALLTPSRVTTLAWRRSVSALGGRED